MLYLTHPQIMKLFAVLCFLSGTTFAQQPAYPISSVYPQQEGGYPRPAGGAPYGNPPQSCPISSVFDLFAQPTSPANPLNAYPQSPVMGLPQQVSEPARQQAPAAVPARHKRDSPTFEPETTTEAPTTFEPEATTEAPTTFGPETTTETPTTFGQDTTSTDVSTVNISMPTPFLVTRWTQTGPMSSMTKTDSLFKFSPSRLPGTTTIKTNAETTTTGLGKAETTGA